MKLSKQLYAVILTPKHNYLISAVLDDGSCANWKRGDKILVIFDTRKEAEDFVSTH